MVVLSTSPGGSGVAFHKHGVAWMVLQEGAKHWWLYPPAGPPTQEAYRAVALCHASALPDVVSRLPPEARPIQVLQRSGEGIYVPPLWWHATFDIGQTMGIGSQYNMADLDILDCHKEYPDSAFVLYHVACELHKTDEVRAMELFEEAIEREPLNFYFHTNQLLFYMNMVFHPRLTVSIIERLMRKVRENLDDRRQMTVQRFAIPTICNFAEWHASHDRLVKYSTKAIASAWKTLLDLARPLLPGGDNFQFTSQLPSLSDLCYTAICSQCGHEGVGKAGHPGTIRAHKFFCDACIEVRESAVCSNCGEKGGEGQMGHPGTDFARVWYCGRCWRLWNSACREGLSDDSAARLVEARINSQVEAGTSSSIVIKGVGGAVNGAGADAAQQCVQTDGIQALCSCAEPDITTWDVVD